MILIVCGPVGAGKTTLVENLCSKYMYNYIPTYTTRPMRQGELPGWPYQFISEAEFNILLHNGEMAEHCVYISDNGIRYQYGVPLSALAQASQSIPLTGRQPVMVLNPDGVRTLMVRYPEYDFHVLLLTADSDVVLKRCAYRGHRKNDILSRWEHDMDEFDALDYSGFVDTTIDTSDLTEEEVERLALQFVETGDISDDPDEDTNDDIDEEENENDD